MKRHVGVEFGILSIAVLFSLAVPQAADAQAPVSASEEVAPLAERFVAAWNDDFPDLIAPFYASDAVLEVAGGVVLQGRDAILREFLRPNVARIRVMRGTPRQTTESEDRVTVEGVYRVRYAPAPDTIEVRVSNRWARQPDGSWRIVAGTFELPADDERGPIRSRFVHSDGVRFHYLDFGGEGLAVVFIPSAERTAYTYIDFAARFADRHRVLALTRRGTGESGGEPGSWLATATMARDVLALLDSLDIERAVVVDRWPEPAIYLAEQHPERVAGLVFLRGLRPTPDLRKLRDQDPTGHLKMEDRLIASLRGLDPDQPDEREPDARYEPLFRRAGTSIEIPSLAFVNETGTARTENEWELDLGFAQWVASEPMSFPDSLSRTFFQRLAEDEELQERVRAMYRDLVAAAWIADEQALQRALGENVRVVQLETADHIGYQYRDAPDLIYPHIRRFLNEVQAKEHR